MKYIYEFHANILSPFLELNQQWHILICISYCPIKNKIPLKSIYSVYRLLKMYILFMSDEQRHVIILCCTCYYIVLHILKRMKIIFII